MVASHLQPQLEPVQMAVQQQRVGRAGGKKSFIVHVDEDKILILLGQEGQGTHRQGPVPAAWGELRLLQEGVPGQPRDSVVITVCFSAHYLWPIWKFPRGCSAGAQPWRFPSYRCLCIISAPENVTYLK